MTRLMDFKETVRYLKTSRATLYRWATEKKIPAIKMGKVWRFKKEYIDKWLDDRMNLKKR